MLEGTLLEMAPARSTPQASGEIAQRARARVDTETKQNDSRPGSS